MQLEFLKFRRMEPGDAKEYKDAANETLEDLKLYKNELAEGLSMSVKDIRASIHYGNLFPKKNIDYFVLMNGRQLVAYGYAVQREGDAWSELGLWVRKRYQGSGCGTLMLTLLAKHAFENHSSVGVYIVRDAGNFAMAALAKKLGFKYDALFDRKPSHELDKDNIENDRVAGIDIRHSLVWDEKCALCFAA
jgi:RimJ/RimL family protein N-acetyltransferase